jgi:hypothetical protein
MKREDVYKSIDSERDYQLKLTEDATRPDMIEDLHVGDTLTAIQYNLNKAVDAWYKDSVPHQETMEYLRKVAGLCVQAGECYGMPKRVSDISGTVQEAKSVFLVHQSHDEHHNIYGVFNTMNEFIESYETEDAITQARLIHNYVIFKMKGKEVIDEFYVDDIQISLPERSEEVQKILFENKCRGNKCK